MTARGTQFGIEPVATGEAVESTNEISRQKKERSYPACRAHTPANLYPQRNPTEQGD